MFINHKILKCTMLFNKWYPSINLSIQLKRLLITFSSQWPMLLVDPEPVASNMVQAMRQEKVFLVNILKHCKWNWLEEKHDTIDLNRKHLFSDFHSWKSGKMKKILLVLLILIISSNQNFTYHQGGNLTSRMGTEKRARSLHPLALPWALHHLLGVLGTFLNSFVLFLFVQERHDFVGAINIMIW